MNARTLLCWGLGSLTVAAAGCASMTGEALEPPPTSKYQSVSLYPFVPPPGVRSAAPATGPVATGPVATGPVALGPTSPLSPRSSLTSLSKSNPAPHDNPSTGKSPAGTATVPSYWTRAANPVVTNPDRPAADPVVAARKEAGADPVPKDTAPKESVPKDPVELAAALMKASAVELAVAPQADPAPKAAPVPAMPGPIPLPAMPNPVTPQPLGDPRPVSPGAPTMLPAPDPAAPPGQPGSSWRPATPDTGGRVGPAIGPIPVPGSGPNVRATPTVGGARLNLAPQEFPADRVIDMTRQFELALAQNRELLGRVRELEATGLGREQALAEAFREAEAAAGEVARARAQLQDMRAEIAALRTKLQQMEKEDIEMLRAVLSALDRLLPPSRREP